MQEGQPWIRYFGVSPEDPGYIYIIESNDRFKIGRTKSREQRFRAAKTWLPDMKLIGIKPFWNVRSVERCLHEGFARCWYGGEWFELLDEGYRETLLDAFAWFSDSDRDRNSVDFVYWFNSDGMSEFVIERSKQRITLPKFLRQESDVRGHR